MPRSTSRGLVPFLMPARLRWRAEDARAVLDRLESSGLSLGEFAAREKLNAVRLYRWRARLGSGRRKPPAFVEIRSTAATAIEVVFRSGHVVRVPEGFDEETLRRVVTVLEEPRSRC